MLRILFEEDLFDDFEDRFDENFEPEDCFEDGPGAGSEPDRAESQEDDFSAREAFIFSTAMGWAYEEGLEKVERWRLERKINEDDKKENM